MNPELTQAIGKALKGSREDFEIIIRQTVRPLYALAYGILQHSGEAEDAVQDAVIKAWNSRWRIRKPEKFLPWLNSITRNTALDLLRKRKPSTPFDSEFDLATPENEKPDRCLERSEIQERLHGHLAKLPEQHRVAVTLKYLDGMDYESIQQTMGITNGSLRGILGRSIETLRKEMRPFLS